MEGKFVRGKIGDELNFDGTAISGLTSDRIGGSQAFEVECPEASDISVRTSACHSEPLCGYRYVLNTP